MYISIYICKIFISFFIKFYIIWLLRNKNNIYINKYSYHFLLVINYWIYIYIYIYTYVIVLYFTVTLITAWQFHCHSSPDDKVMHAITCSILYVSLGLTLLWRHSSTLPLTLAVTLYKITLITQWAVFDNIY